MISEGKVFAERYRVEEFIGKGGMALVFRAVDMRTGHNVAIKVLKSEFNTDTEFLERFAREAQAASRMNHHNIVNLLDVGVEGEDRYLVFEYISGSTLRDILIQKKQLPTKTAVQITIRILSALQHAHQNNIIHRDIKPQNILINADGLVKVADFGIARIVNTGTVSKDGMVVGSVHYSSPEQASGQEVTPPSDLYSTGVVLYEMITGRVPFVGDNPVAVAMQHIQATPPPILDYAPATPPAVVAVIMKALEKKPENRFSSAKEMAEALTDAMNGKLDIASLSPAVEEPLKRETSREELSRRRVTPVDPGERQRRTRLIRNWLIVCSAVFVLIAFGVTFLLLNQMGNITVPDLLDYSAADARKLVEAAGLVWQEETAYHDSIAQGYVINQSPGPDEQVEKGTVVTAIISEGPQVQQQMPSLVSLSYSTAVAKLKKLGISDVVVVKTVSVQPVDTVVSQKPAADTLLTKDLSVELTISGGSTAVPFLIDLLPEEAEELLEESNLVLGTISYEEVPEDQVDLVVDQEPVEYSNVMLGIPVAITVGVEQQPYQAEMDLDIPADANQARIVTVVMVQDDEEIVKYECTLNAGEALKKTIPLKSSVNGIQLCEIYLDDQLYQQVNLEFRMIEDE